MSPVAAAPSGRGGGCSRSGPTVGARALVGLVVVSIMALSGCRSSGPARPSPPAGHLAHQPVFGVTVEDLAGSDLSALVGALVSLPYRPFVRVYFDVHEPPTKYVDGVRAISAHASVMGEMLDSSDEAAITVDSLSARARDYVSALGRYVTVWEVGNEVNGDWLGPYPEVEAKMLAVYRAVEAAGGRSALTLYGNEFGPDHCGDGPGELTPEQFAGTYVPANVRAALRYVWLSYYPSQCDGAEPDGARLGRELEALHRLFPGADLGLGETGLPDPVTTSSVAAARQVMGWAYSLDPGLPYYVGGYFWWYAGQDALGRGRPLAADLAMAFRREHAALGR